MNFPADTATHRLRVRWLGQRAYEPVWQAMQRYTLEREELTKDEIWLVEHPPVYTLGMRCKAEDLEQKTDIPVIKTDRGGQITYHGPGQIVVYVLFDLRRCEWGIKKLVALLEQTVIDLLAEQRIEASRKTDAPGVYVNGKKIAALGLRVRRGCSYHGLALNVNMDLNPFNQIDPCGFPGLETTQLSNLDIHASVRETGKMLAEGLAIKLGYNGCEFTDDFPEQTRNA